MSTAEHLFEFPQFPQSQGGFDFLSPERQQKYDLLVHLLANLGQPLFLSGPGGTGKSTFLHHLHECPPQGWLICLLEASPGLNLEQVQQALSRCLGVREDSKSLRSHLETLALHDEPVVLALDEVGPMIPGALDVVCRFAAQYPALRLVAALRPDELHIKAVTDPWAVGEAQVIELPPLTESQCTDYLNRMWTRLGRKGEPDQAVALEIYRRSHGIPARIRQEVLDLVGKPPLRWHLSLAKPVYLALGIIGGAVAAVTYWQKPLLRLLPASSANKAEQFSTPKPVDQTMLASDASPATQPSAPLPQEPPGNPVLPAGDQTTDGPVFAASPPVAEPLPEVSDHAVQQAAASEPAVLPVEPAVLKTSASSGENPATQAADALDKAPQPPNEAIGLNNIQPKLRALGVNSKEWLARQKPSHFSLQLATSDKPENLLALAKRYPQLRPLTIAVKTKQGRSEYVLLYGAFADIGAVEQAVRKLPPGIRNASVRRLSSVQTELAR